MSRIASVPYVVGQWVRGPQFYGREALIHEVLEGPRQSSWILGNRRVGKTSLLKEIERRTTESDEGWLPLFWDLQGIDTPADLALALEEAILDREAEFRECGLELGMLGLDNVNAMLRGLKREVAAQGRQLLVLCDEAESLVTLADIDERLVSTLGSALRTGNIRSVMASTIRLWALAGRLPSLLQEVTPPIYISGLGDEDAAALVRQAQVEPAARPDFDPDTVEEICLRCGNHPYLLQLLSKRTMELDDLEKATDQLLWDPMIGHFFTVDFESLSPDEQFILGMIATKSETAARLSELKLPGGTSLDQSLLRLQQLGFTRASDASPEIASAFFEHWLRESADTQRGSHAPAPAQKAPRLRIGEWTVEPNANTLFKGGDEVRLEPRAMNLLLFLSSNASEVVSKDQIVDAVWDGAFISESALTRTIADLRKALGDDARAPRYIETISKRGYRLVAAVDESSRSDDEPMPDSSSRFTLVWNGRAHRVSGREFVLGRDPQCSLCIASSLVSRRHARLVVTTHSATIEDLGSRNGTWVNGTRVTAPLRLTGDEEIQVGSETLTFQDGASPATTHTDLGGPGRGQP